jgi:cytosine/adenosine deaminase-related metal-dependent hydrolase
MLDVGGSTAATGVTAFVGGRVQPSPDAAVIPDGVVLIKDGVIAAVGPRAAVRVPDDATRVDCTAGTVLAGFWNSHVHFIEAAWRGAESRPAVELARAIRRC